MKIFSALATAVVSLVLAIPALAQDTERVKAELKKRVPEAPVDAVRKVPYGGLYEVTMGGEIFYTDENASFIVMGSLVDLRTKENVTEARLRVINKVEWSELPLKDAVKIVRGSGLRKVAIFEDPNCGYCKRFERDLAGVNDVTIYVFLYPILSQSSVDKSKAVWCSPDRVKAWLDLMVRDVPIGTNTSCANPIDRVLAFGQSKRIQGTPTIFFEDGDRVPGVMSMADFERKLAQGKAAPAPRAAAQ